MGRVPIIEATVDIGPGGLLSAITGSLDLGATDTGNTAGTPTFASWNSSISTTIRP